MLRSRTVCHILCLCPQCCKLFLSRGNISPRIPHPRERESPRESIRTTMLPVNLSAPYKSEGLHEDEVASIPSRTAFSQPAEVSLPTTSSTPRWGGLSREISSDIPLVDAGGFEPPTRVTRTVLQTVATEPYSPYTHVLLYFVYFL